MNENNGDVPDDIIEMGPWYPRSSHDSRSTDLILLVESRKFHVHKDVLVEACDYFRAMFQSQMVESKDSCISLKLVKQKPFEELLTGFYTGSLELNEHNMFRVAEIAHMFQVRPALMHQCTNFFVSKITSENCFEIMFFSDQYNLHEVYNFSRRYCLAYFVQLQDSPSFLKLTPSELMNYLSDQYLVVDHEAEVLEAVTKWFAENKDEKTELDEIVRSCVWLNDDPHALDTAVTAVRAVLSHDKQPMTDDILDIFGTRPEYRDIVLFWSLLNNTDDQELTGVVQLCRDTSKGIKMDSMTDVLKEPTSDPGCALCVRGPFVYLSGGGPVFGKLNWIRQLWRFDSFKAHGRWSVVGELFETRRHHAMVALEDKLYIFGGFGKFRVLSRELHCYCLRSGSWQKLQPMPVHEIKPVAATSHHCIYYIDKSWQLHSFNTVSRSWTTIGTVDQGNGVTKPLALFFIPKSSTKRLTILSSGSLNQFHITTVKVCKETKYCSVVNTCSFEKTYSYISSVFSAGKVLIFFMNEHMYYTHQESDHCFLIMCHNPQDNTVCQWRKLSNVKNFLNVLVVPYLPESFPGGKMGPPDDVCRDKVTPAGSEEEKCS